VKKEDGFPGQFSFVIPELILAPMKDNLLIADLYITDIGYYLHRPDTIAENSLQETASLF
jgi:hypothetical protein